MSGLTPADKTTIFDEEIALLESRRAEIETEREKLLKGQISVRGPDGTSMMNINLGALSAAASDNKTVERNLRQTLLENPLVPVLDNSFKKTRELRDEMVGRGEISHKTSPASPFGRVVQSNQHLNQAARSKNNILGKLLASPWWLLVGINLIFVWCGGPLIYALSGGTIGGNQLGTAVPVPTTTVKPSVNPTTTAKVIGAVLTDFKTGNSSDSTRRPLNVQLQTDLAVITVTPTALTRVGNTPNSAAGFNGPHGAFLAPSRMKIDALSIDTPVSRALTEESGSEEATIIEWPRPGEVVQTGAYPGEIGNMIFLGNQKDLAGLRRIQQNDEVTVYDRKGNAFIYRILAFSADGQTEREVNPTVLDDAWVFAPTQQAILTIIVTYPQPLPAVDPNQTGTNQVTPRDDYLVQKKLAYRAVLAMYAPAPVTPAGTPVAVPDSAWQTVAAPQHPISQPVTTSNPVTAVTTAGSPTTQLGGAPVQTTPGVIPSGLPATGEGGARPTGTAQNSKK